MRKFKGALLGLRQFLATDSPLNMMKYGFYFTSKALFIPNIFKFFLTNNCNTYFAKYLEK